MFELVVLVTVSESPEDELEFADILIRRCKFYFGGGIPSQEARCVAVAPRYTGAHLFCGAATPCCASTGSDMSAKQKMGCACLFWAHLQLAETRRAETGLIYRFKRMKR